MSKYPILKVTSKTTEGQIFAAVVEHLRSQGRRCAGFNGETCANRGPNETACAAAALMSDHEAITVTTCSFAGRQEEDVPKRLLRFRGLIDGLQAAHDHSRTPEEINAALQKIADEKGLEFKPLAAWE